MCVSGQLEYVGTGSGYFVTNDKYDIIGFDSPGAGDSALYIVLDKFGNPYSIDSNDAGFNVVEFYTTRKVV